MGVNTQGSDTQKMEEMGDNFLDLELGTQDSFQNLVKMLRSIWACCEQKILLWTKIEVHQFYDILCDNNYALYWYDGVLDDIISGNYIKNY